MKALRFILIAAVMSFSSTLLALEAEPVELRWSEVRGAGGYQVEVKAENGSIVRRTIKKSNISMRLKPGSYALRIIVLNKFGRPAADSGWRPLRVSLAVKPAIRAVGATKTHKASGLPEVRIRGRNFIKQTQVTLRGPDGLEHEFKPRIINGKELVIRMRAHLPEGKYDVIIKNPGEDAEVRKGGLAFARQSPGAYVPGRVEPRPIVKPEQALWRSAVLPGWGQFARGEYYKTALITGGYLLPLVFVADARHHFLRASNKVSTQETVTLLIASDTTLGTEVGAINVMLSDTARVSRTRAARRYRLAGGLAAAFYIYNLVDAYSDQDDDGPPSPGGALWRSAVLPGWGQGARGDNLKGALLLGGTLLAAGFLADARLDYARAVRERDTVNTISVIVPLQSSLLAANIWILDNADAASARVVRSARTYRGASIALAGLYLFNLYDAWSYYRGAKATALSGDANGSPSGRMEIAPGPDPAGGTAISVSYRIKF